MANDTIIAKQFASANAMEDDLSNSELLSKKLNVPLPPKIDMPKELDFTNKTSVGKIVFALTVICIYISVGAIFVFMPKEYDDIVVIKIFGWLWFIGFIPSLFLIGKKLQSKDKPNVVKLAHKKEELYHMIRGVNDSLKGLRSQMRGEQLDNLMYDIKENLVSQTRGKRLDDLLYDIKVLEERLSSESDFGYGGGYVINCENNIAMQTNYMVDVVAEICDENCDESIQSMNVAIMNINSLLKKRAELLKREKTGEIISINRSPFNVGRSNAVDDYVITDNHFVSRSHITLIVRDDVCYIIDNKSLNRTFVNSSALVPASERVLSNGDIIKLYNERFTYLKYLKDVYPN